LATAWNAMTGAINSLNYYGLPHFGDYIYDPSTPPNGAGSRVTIGARKQWQMVGWLMYARTGDRHMLDWDSSITSHGVNMDYGHATLRLNPDANNNQVDKKIGQGFCDHWPTHQYPTNVTTTGIAGAFDCSEGQEPNLEYVSTAAEMDYVLTGHDRSMEFVVHELYPWVIVAGGESTSHPAAMGARNLGGCFQLGTDAYKLSGTGLALAEWCFANAVNPVPATGSEQNTIGNPIGFVTEDEYGNEINIGYWYGTWLDFSWAEFAELDPSYCANDWNSVSHCVRTEFNRFAEAVSSMGKTSDSSGLYPEDRAGKAMANSYAYTSNSAFPLYAQRNYDWALQPSSQVTGSSAVVSYPTSVPDVHEWSNYLQNIPFLEKLLSGIGIKSYPANPPYVTLIPQDGVHSAQWLTNKASSGAWTFSFFINDWADFLDGEPPPSPTINVLVLNPLGGTALSTSISACRYQGPTPCIPNSITPIQSNTATVGEGGSITNGGTDNSYFTFTVPEDGHTGEYTIKLSAAGGINTGTINNPVASPYVGYTYINLNDSAAGACTGTGSSLSICTYNGSAFTGAALGVYTVATLPGSPTNGLYVAVTDAVADCAHGGGSNAHLCQYKTGTGWVDLGFTNVTGPSCVGDPIDRYTCYAYPNTTFALMQGTSLGNLVGLSPTVASDGPNGCDYTIWGTNKIGQGLHYFKVPAGATRITASMSWVDYYLVSPSGKYYPQGSTNTVAAEPGMWAIGNALGNEAGGYCISLTGVKPLISSSPQTYYDSPNQSVYSGANAGYGSPVTVNFGSGTCSITTTTLPGGTVGVPYATTPNTAYCVPPDTWSISAGSLPGWASLNASTGNISGTPTVAATANFTMHVVDSGSNAYDQPFSITIAGGAAPGASSISAGTAVSAGTIRH